MSAKPIRFGTDGVRGRAHDEISVDLARRIAMATGAVIDADTAIIGRDTRESGPELADALAAGFSDVGVRPLMLGVAPTPAVAHLAATDGAIGAMVSASHNPWFDNGIKIFGPGGLKLSDDQQHQLEQALDASAAAPLPASDLSLADDSHIGARVGEWVSVVKASATTLFDGLRVVLDAANGAGSHVVAPALADLGAEVTVIANQPDGRNINEACGSTHPEALIAAVQHNNAHVGLALDGDADRLLAVDAAGQLVDGDHLIAICARDRYRRGLLANDTVVVTVMTNLGFRLAMDEVGINVAETPVGDRHVLEALERNGWNLGGEQSGHLIFRDIATTGDGFLTAVQLLDVLARTERPLADLAAESMTRLPQVLRNVRIDRKVPDVADQLADEIAAVEAELGDSGRVLIRPSGTEPLIRVMVEAASGEQAEQACERLCAVVESRFA